MPGLPSTVDIHLQRDAIVKDLLSGVPLAKISSAYQPKISIMSLSRYRQSLLKRNQSLSQSATISSTCATKDWVETEYIDLVTLAKARKDLPTARATLDSIARLKGYDAPRRTESVSLNLHALGTAALAEQLKAALHSLPEHERKSLGPVIDLESDT